MSKDDMNFDNFEKEITDVKHYDKLYEITKTLADAIKMDRELELMKSSSRKITGRWIIIAGALGIIAGFLAGIGLERRKSKDADHKHALILPKETREKLYSEVEKNQEIEDFITIAPQVSPQAEKK